KRVINSENPIKEEHIEKDEFNECQFFVSCDNEVHCVDISSACCSCSVGRLVTRLEKITSEGQWETMLATLGSNVSLKKAGVSIRVQPTSIARRSIGVTKGS
ncbi:unnamed protein product, partial [Larinioides sclopetarius]